jgi:pimeloyl-ACP methyl ester carboxylesterase
VKDNVLYITGRGGDHTKGLGGYISNIVNDYKGLSIDIPFLRQDIDDQIKTIRRSIEACSNGLVIANSYGAYLTLLSLIDFEHEVAEVVLLSPVLGRAIAKDRMYYSRPPASIRVSNALQERRINLPEKTSIYIGDRDELYDPGLLHKYAEIIGEDRVFVLQGQRHNIDKDFMQDMLNRILDV